MAKVIAIAKETATTRDAPTLKKIQRKNKNPANRAVANASSR